MSNPVPLSEFGHLELVDYFDYLDDLRDSGRTNMLGAASWLMQEHGLSRDEAVAVWLGWSSTFDGVSKSDERVDAALEAPANP